MGGPVSISVVIPAYNSAATLPRAIASARQQTLKPLEIIVVDDHSTDATAAVASSYGAEVRVISLPAQKGAAGARNAGIEAAIGNAIAFQDSDDEWLPAKLQKQIAVLTSSPLITLVACASNLISPDGRDLGDLYHGHAAVTGPDSWRALLAYNFVATPSVLAWRKDLILAGGFDEKLKIGEDQDLWIRLSLRGELGYVPESLVKVHARENSLSAEHTDPIIYTLPMIQRHVANLQGRLSDKEVRNILGKRFALVGRVAYARGDYRHGLPLIYRSMMLGYQPLGSLYYLASASPPAAWLKRRLGIGRHA
jgi:glycosyltransferase involved in cell wall biosynthesis